MKYALIMNENSYPGREYLRVLRELFNKPEILVIGNFPEVDKEEEERCGALWQPHSQAFYANDFVFWHFESLKCNELYEFLMIANYSVAIQGGTGILKKKIIECFDYGILNFHPGDLPEYRGCSAPEWQLYEKKKLIVTCHLIDEGIDTGKIVAKRELKPDYTSYESYRASVYPLTADFIYDLFLDEENLMRLIRKSTTQDESLANYKPYIGVEKINLLKDNFFNNQ